MKKPSLPFLLLTFFCFNNNLLSGQKSSETTQKAWKLIWHDEFNGKTLNKKKWNVLTLETSKHGELQYYIHDPPRLQRGVSGQSFATTNSTQKYPQKSR